MTSLKAYYLLEDAWQDGVEAWCRAASAHVLQGGAAWMITPGDGHGNGLKRRLLEAGVSLAGVQFLQPRTLRRELCARLGVAPPALGRETLELLLRWGSAEAVLATQNAGPGLRALEDFAAAGWDADSALPADLRPGAPLEWLPKLRATGSWIPAVDRQLLELSGAGSRPRQAPLSLCVLGWDAGFWPQFVLLQAAWRSAQAAQLFVPLPRGTSESVQQAWVTALEEASGAGYTVCPSSGFVSGQAALATRLEGADLAPAGETTAPELLVGAGWRDTTLLARDFVARWLVGPHAAAAAGARLAIVAAARNGSAVCLVRALAEAGIAVEDELGELPEPTLTVQILRTIVAYHQNGAMVDPLLALLELLNEHARQGWSDAAPATLRANFPLDVSSARRALQGAFSELQDSRVPVLCTAPAFTRHALAAPVRAVVAQLGEWPETLAWDEALARWNTCLAAFGVSTEALEPGWSRQMVLPLAPPQPVPLAVFWDYLAGVLAGVAARRPAQTAQRFARVVVTTLAGAAGQAWNGVLFLDANENTWPIFPAESPCLDDPLRQRLNSRRLEAATRRGSSIHGHLLTSADCAQLDQFHFLEILENCTGPLAFAGPAQDPAELNKELYPNEWVLRCLVESAGDEPGPTPLQRWREATRRFAPALPPWPKPEAAHLQAVFGQRRDPGVPFDETSFDFSGLGGPDELPWTDPWSARDLEAAWHRPASLALKQIFGADAASSGDGEFARGQKQVIGKLVHQWVRLALGGSRQARRFEAGDWQRALSVGLDEARRATEKTLRAALPPAGPASDAVSPWWAGTLLKAGWAARHCLQAVADIAQAAALNWLAVDAKLTATVKTARGPLRLRAACDVLLLDRPSLEGAACQIIDIRSGSKPKTGALTAAKLENGEGIPLGAMLLAALEQGASPEHTRAGIAEPQSANAAVLTARMRPALQASFAPLAERQISSRFGQHAPAGGGGRGDERGESLPLATTPIPAAVLEAKAGLEAS